MIKHKEEENNGEINYEDQLILMPKHQMTEKDKTKSSKVFLTCSQQTKLIERIKDIFDSGVDIDLSAHCWVPVSSG